MLLEKLRRFEKGEVNSFAGRSETLNQHFGELTVNGDMFNELSAQFEFLDVCVCY